MSEMDGAGTRRPFWRWAPTVLVAAMTAYPCRKHGFMSQGLSIDYVASP
jgi:hypothetical protein